MSNITLALIGVACSPGEPEDPLGPTTLYEPPPPEVDDPGTPPPVDTGNPGAPIPPGTVADCADGETYPPGAVEPMTFGEVLSPYAWPAAVEHATGEVLDLDLASVPCALDPDIDWSPFDVLLFVSIPAW